GRAVVGSRGLPLGGDRLVKGRGGIVVCLQQDFQSLSQVGVGAALALQKRLSGLPIRQVQGGGEHFFPAAGVGGHESLLRGLSQISAERPARVSRIRRFFFAAQRGGQDGPGIGPVAERRRPGDTQRVGRFFEGEAGEQPQAGDLRRRGIFGR